MSPTIAVNSNCYHSFSIEDAIAGTKKAGFSAIELTATKGWTEHVFPTMPIKDLWKIKDELLEARITPVALSGHTNIMDPARVPDFIDNMRLANFFGVPTIVSSVGEAHLKDNVSLSDDQVAERLSQLLPYLEGYSLNLVIENHGEHATGERILSIIDRVNHPLIKINFDTANGIFYAGKDPVEDLRSCVEHVGYVHLKDKIGGEREWNFPALGKGVVDIPEILKVLQDAGTSAPISIEIEFTSAGAKDAAEVDQAVLDSKTYLSAIDGALFEA